MIDDERTEGEDQAAAEPEAPVSAPTDQAEEKPKRRRAAKAKAGEEPEEKPKRRRTAKAKADEEPDEKPKRRRAAEAQPAEEKPKRRRAAKAEAAEEKPKRRRAAKAGDDDTAEAKPRARRTAKKDEPEAEEKPASRPSTDEREDAPSPSRRSSAADAPVSPPGRRRAPARTRRQEAAANGRVVVRAKAKYVRSSARKARLVCDLIRGKSVDDARAILATTTRSVARDWSKLLESAVANAENNHELDGDDLRVFAVHADEGPTLKRYRPRAMGRATRIRKRTSHLSIQLTSKE